MVGSHEGIWLCVRWVQKEGRIREGCLLPEPRGTVRAVAMNHAGLSHSDFESQEGSCDFKLGTLEKLGTPSLESWGLPSLPGLSLKCKFCAQ